MVNTPSFLFVHTDGGIGRRAEMSVRVKLLFGFFVFNVSCSDLFKRESLLHLFETEESRGWILLLAESLDDCRDAEFL